METPRSARSFVLALCALLTFACTTRPSGTADRADVAEAAEPANTAGPAGAEVFYPRLAVAGFPFPIRLVFKGEAKVPTSTGLFEADNPFSVALRSVAGREEVTYVFPARASRRALLGPVGARRSGRRELKRPTFALPEGRACEIVLDLSRLACLREEGEGPRKLFRYRRLAPGSYALEMRRPALALRTRPRPVEFTAPTLPEHRLLARLNNFGPSGTIWKTFVLRYPEAIHGVDLARFRPQARAQMGYHLLLARLVHSDAPLAELEITDAEVAELLPAYRTEALILRCEIELARGDDEAAEKTRAAILAARPYAMKALEDIAERGGVVGSLRRATGGKADAE